MLATKNRKALEAGLRWENTVAGNGAGLVMLDGASGNLIGSSSADGRNVISANQLDGVLIRGQGSDDNVLVGNYIGSDRVFSALTEFGNGQNGVRVRNTPSGTQIGGVEAGDRNRIANNGRSGVQIDQGAPQGHSIIGNEIRNNANFGIDLSADAVVTFNDVGDADTGANGLLNFPEFNTVSHSGGLATVDFQLDVSAGDYRIEFFANLGQGGVCAPPEGQVCAAPFDHYYGEGELFVHVQEYSHAGAGSQAFQAIVPMLEERFVTATCTEILAPGKYGSTSEFSRSVPTTFP